MIILDGITTVEELAKVIFDAYCAAGESYFNIPHGEWSDVEDDLHAMWLNVASQILIGNQGTEH